MSEANNKAVKHAWQKRLVFYVPNIIAVIILIILFLIVPAYAKSMLIQILIFSIFAMSLNLLIGYTGLFSAGHAAFFGAGGYTSAILITHFGITSFWLAAPAGILVAILTAAIFGVIALRVTGLYFLFITLALAELLSNVALKWTSVTGGDGGIMGIGYPDLGFPFTMTTTSFYYLVLTILVICCFLIYRLVNSPFGYALQGIREDEHLMQHLGYHTWLYKYVVFIIAGAFAGIAGVLFGHFNSLFVPPQCGVVLSFVAVLMVTLGGARVFFGPIIGAVLVLFTQYYASLYAPERWPLILGAVFVLSVVLLPRGIGFHLLRLWKKVGYGYGSDKG